MDALARQLADAQAAQVTMRDEHAAALQEARLPLHFPSFPLLSCRWGIPILSSGTSCLVVGVV